MSEIFNILKMWIEKPHQLDHCVRIPLPLFLILKGQQVLDHLLDVTPVFTHHQMVPRGIVFHTIYIHIKDKSTGKMAKKRHGRFAHN